MSGLTFGPETFQFLGGRISLHDGGHLHLLFLHQLVQLLILAVVLVLTGKLLFLTPQTETKLRLPFLDSVLSLIFKLGVLIN